MGLFSAINEKKYLNEIAELKKQAEEQQEKIDELQNEIRTLHESYNALNEKYTYYKETFETLDELQLDKKAANYLTNRRRTLALANLINEVSNEQSVGIEHLKKELDTAIEKQRKNDEKARQSCPNGDSQGIASDDLFTYNPKDEGVEITGYTGFDTKGKLYIPDTINGLPVLGIGARAFTNAEFDTIHIPDSVRYIEYWAFENCKNLTYVNMPKNLKKLGSGSFENTNLRKVVIPNGITEIETSCFSRCGNLSEIILNEGLERITPGAFSGVACRNIVIPKSVTCIDIDAFKVDKHNGKYDNYQQWNIAFLGSEDIKVIFGYGQRPTIYCLAGSKIQQYTKEQGYTVRPLSEFKM